MFRRFISWLCCVCVCLFAVSSTGITASAVDLSDQWIDISSEPVLFSEQVGNYTVWPIHYTGVSTRELFVGYSITLPESVPSDQPFDFSCYIDFEGFGLDDLNQYQKWQFIACDSSWNTIFSWYSTQTLPDATMELRTVDTGYRYSVSNIVSAKPIKYIRIYHCAGNSVLEEISCSISNIEVSARSSTGLISGILSLISDIFTAIITLPSSIASSLASFFDSVVSAISKLPSNIKSALTSLFNSVTSALTEVKNTVYALCERLINGIKSLFVPSSDDLTYYSNKWDLLLRSRFGALYDCIDLVKSSSARYKESLRVDMFGLPTITLKFGDVPWTFGGWLVRPVPVGFESIRDIVSGFVNVVCTLAFLGGLKRRFERLVDA